MANDAQTLALAQTFYETARYSPADRKSQAVSKIQVALNELIDSISPELAEYRREEAQRQRFAELNRNPPPVELDPILNAERN